MNTADILIPALTLWREARGESRAAKAAVYNMILNRANDSRNRWPKTATEVCLQPWQFSSFNFRMVNGKPVDVEVNAVQFPSPKNKADWDAWLDCVAVVEAPLGGDSTQGANHYHDSSVDPPAKAWLGGAATKDDLLAKLTCKIGPFSFYRL